MADTLLKSTARVGLAGVLVAACAPAVPPAPPLRAAAPPIEVDRGLPDAGWGVVVSERFFVELPLPDFQAWNVDDRRDRWLVASHVPSKSMLWLRTWREGSVVGRADCEEVARQWRPELFGKDPSALSERRPLPVPEGFDTEIGFAVHRKGSALAGVAVAVGANVRRCFTLAYVTKDEGGDADRVIAERLAFVTEAIFARVKGRSIDDRVGVPVR